MAFVFRGLDFSRLWQLLASQGPLLLVILVPWGVTVALDSAAWRMIFARMGRVVSYPRLFGVRLSAEAVLMTVPTGSFVSDSLTPRLLKTRCGVPVAEGLASIAARKCLLGISQAAYLGLAAVVGYSALGATASMTGLRAPGTALLILAIVLLGGSILATRLLARGALASAALAGLRRVPSRRLGAFLDAHAESFTHTDEYLATVFHRRLGELGLPVGAYLVAWLAEAIETYLILWLLNSGLRFAQVMPAEAFLVTIRVMAFFVPGGLGIQDVGYAMFLAAFGVPNAVSVAAAFVLLKRAKEAVWTAIGYVLFLRQPELTTS
jgi:uncharacterized protein (TIRG00374 family)